MEKREKAADERDKALRDFAREIQERERTLADAEKKAHKAKTAEQMRLDYLWPVINSQSIYPVEPVKVVPAVPVVPAVAQPAPERNASDIACGVASWMITAASILTAAATIFLYLR